MQMDIDASMVLIRVSPDFIAKTKLISFLSERFGVNMEERTASG